MVFVNEINFNIEDIENINFDLGVTVKEIAPSLENLNVIPTREQQIFTHEDSYGYDTVTVEPYTLNVSAKTITENGTYNASDDNLDGYSSVEVATSGVDINDYFNDTISSGSSSVNGLAKSIKKTPTFEITGNSTQYLFTFMSALEEISFLDTSNVIYMSYMFKNCSNLKTIPLLDTGKATNMSYMFQYCDNLESIPQLNTSNLKHMYNMFQYCSNLKTIPLLDTSNVISISDAFSLCTNLLNLGGFKDLGKAYSTTQSENHSYYTLSLTNCNHLTHDSLMNVINNLYDIKSAGCNNQKLVLGGTNKAKLTEEEIAIATNKGWNVS